MSLPTSEIKSVFHFLIAVVSNIPRPGWAWERERDGESRRYLGQERGLHSPPAGGHWSRWTDEGMPGNGNTIPCFYPSFEALENIHRFYPQATIMTVVTEPKSWLESARSLVGRWQWYCKDKGATDEDWVNFYDKHTEHVRRFAKEHPSLTYVEIPLDSPPLVFEEKTGVQASCCKHQS